MKIGGNKMSLFSKKEESTQLAEVATIILTCNSIPSHKKATYWYDVILNDKFVARIEQNGIPSTFTTSVDNNILRLELIIKENNGRITKMRGPKQKLELRSGETVKILHQKLPFSIFTIFKNRFIIEQNR
jgi:hypothetical protein